MNALAPGCVRDCRGCGHRDLTSAESSAQKTRWLSRTLGAFGALDAIESDGVRFGYRRKSTLRCERVPGGEGHAIGMRIRDRDDDRVLPIPDCPVHSEEVNEAFRAIARTFPEDLPLVYAIASGDLLSLVLKQPRDETTVARAREWWEARRFASARGAYLNFHPAAGDRITAKNGWVHLGGEGWGAMRFFGREFRHGPGGFLQVQAPLYEAALSRARGFLLRAPGPVADLYSGVGVSLALWREAARETIGVELSGEAAEHARRNSGAAVLQGKCGERVPQLREFVGDRGFSAFVNPPRTGLESEVRRWLASERGRVARIAYLSCSAGTLARDLGELTEAGYRVETLASYDFFPGTPHVETLALLT